MPSMNHNKKVVILILSVTIVYLLLSVFSSDFTHYFPNFKNINLVSDLLPKEKEIKKPKIKLKRVIPKNEADTAAVVYTNFEEYNKKGTIVEFDHDSLQPSLKKVGQKLVLLSQNKKVKVRIAWFGDSQIEGDFITQDLRNLLQNQFGQQKGVGFVPVYSISSDFRQTAKITTVGDLRSDNFKKMDSNSSIFFSGYSFFSNDLTIDFKDNIKKEANQITEKWLLYGKGDSIAVKINDSIIKYPAASDFNRILIGKSTASNVKFEVMSSETPLYGMSSEPESGVVVDNFSFRGITGIELKKLNVDLLNKLNESGYYDLIVFQYGVNLMFKPNDTNYDYYYKTMNPVIKKLKGALNKSEFLIFSCSDRAFKYDNEWQTAVGIDSLIYVQAKLAYENKIPFYNFYESMGGRGTIVKWADSTVQYANKDYIHFNFRGSKAIAQIIYKAIINDYNKSLKHAKSKKSTIKKDTINSEK
jgi:lysophospholipase L1-like esterase